MAKGTVNAPPKKVDSSKYATKEDLKTISLTPGPAGKSAYEIAVEGGYKGTEEEFAKALSAAASGNGNGGDSLDKVTVTLSVDWTEQDDGTHAQSVAVEGVTGEAEQPIWVDCETTKTDIEADVAVLSAWGCINHVEPAAGQLTFYCYGDIPDVAIPVQVVIGV